MRFLLLLLAYHAFTCGAIFLLKTELFAFIGKSSYHYTSIA
ncbi:hypothetical protein HMPREF0556_12362 [Listeria grayi DSM 20601]|uniref:Uncharacterized protein n=1 Tax=Listeria grayi DSM 20601 TaxID=525367 RepID=D7UZB0_LISGR|nr:hypothetical protein HMPREF0556_12362 [Listeria grayi DSM 20601]